jgi:hypothetical protein
VRQPCRPSGTYAVTRSWIAVSAVGTDRSHAFARPQFTLFARGTAPTYAVAGSGITLSAVTADRAYAVAGSRVALSAGRTAPTHAAA